MGILKADEVNKAFLLTCDELKSQYAKYPMKYERWLTFDEVYDGKPVFVASEINDGLKTDYVYCKRGPKGKGYYHLLTKTSYVNLYSRIVSEGSGTCCGFGDAAKADAWDTTRLVLYARTRSSKPDDDAAKEQCVDHQVGTKLNPVHGLKL